MEARRIDFDEGFFEANGHKYFMSSTLSIDRFQEFERLQVHVGFGKDFENMYNRLKDAYEYLNKGKIADGAVVIHNLINGVAQTLEKREHPVLEMCALFLNREGEDVAKYDADISAQKIADWKKDGYAIQDFFQLAFNYVRGYITAYEEIIQNISQEAEGAVKSTGEKGS